MPFVIAVIAASVIYTWLYNNTDGSLLIIVLYHAASNLPITVLVSSPASQQTAFLIYVALTIATAVTLVIATGAENLSRTAHRQIEQP